MVFTLCHNTFAHSVCRALDCSKCLRTKDDVLGTKEEWVSLGASDEKWWELAELDEDDARFWHDAALCGQFAGYMPPWRPKAVRMLKAPQFRNSPCQVGFGCPDLAWDEDVPDLVSDVDDAD